MKHSVDKKIAIICAVAIIALAGCGSSTSTDDSISQAGGAPIVVDSVASMGVADIKFVQMGNSPLTINFEAVDPGATFLLVAGTSSISDAMSVSISDYLQSDVEKQIAPSQDKGAQLETTGESSGPEEIFSASLRESEREFAKTMQAPESSVKDASGSARAGFGGSGSIRIGVGRSALRVGDTQSFRVLASLVSVTEYANVTASARCTTSNLALFVDMRVGDDVLPQGKIREFCDTFDDIANWEYQLLGSASDINGDGVVTVLITPQLNLLGSTPGHIVGGYFYAADLYARSEQNPTSN
ncbi:MAG: hypothetical protein WC690_01080, partial [bacterium]